MKTVLFRLFSFILLFCCIIAGICIAETFRGNLSELDCIGRLLFFSGIAAALCQILIIAVKRRRNIEG